MLSHRVGSRFDWRSRSPRCYILAMVLVVLVVVVVHARPPPATKFLALTNIFFYRNDFPKHARTHVRTPQKILNKNDVCFPSNGRCSRQQARRGWGFFLSSVSAIFCLLAMLGESTNSRSCTGWRRRARNHHNPNFDCTWEDHSGNQWRWATKAHCGFKKRWWLLLTAIWSEETFLFSSVCCISISVFSKDASRAQFQNFQCFAKCQVRYFKEE